MGALDLGLGLWGDPRGGSFFGKPTLQDLFRYGAGGAAYAFPDMSSWFQDAAGTVPVTAIGQQVYRVADISGRSNHLLQATANFRPRAARAPADGVRNLLTGTASMATQSLTVAAAAHTLRFSGTGTVTLSGASTAGPLVGTGAGNRVSLTFTPTAGALTLTVSGSVTEAQLELGAGTAYQAVTDPWDVTEAGKRDCYCLYGDGVDDTMATAGNVFPVRNGVSLVSAIAIAGLGPTAGATPVFGAYLGIEGFTISARRSAATVRQLSGYIRNAAGTYTYSTVAGNAGFDFGLPVVAAVTQDADIMSVWSENPTSNRVAAASLGSTVSDAIPIGLFQTSNNGAVRWHGGIIIDRPLTSLEREFAIEEYAYLSGAIE